MARSYVLFSGLHGCGNNIVHWRLPVHLQCPNYRLLSINCVCIKHTTQKSHHTLGTWNACFWIVKRNFTNKIRILCDPVSVVVYRYPPKTKPNLTWAKCQLLINFAFVKWKTTHLNWVSCDWKGRELCFCWRVFKAVSESKLQYCPTHIILASHLLTHHVFAWGSLNICRLSFGFSHTS
jgi:hypothetical protein